MPNAQHPKAAQFVRQDLFAGATTFTELEARIAALADEQSRGDAFEVFAEAYLATQRKHDAANVWPLTSVPTQILQNLGLAAKDYGVDGVFKTLLGHFNAYQVKFRTNRPALTWRELSTFMGLADSPQIRSRVLFTNCDEVTSVLNDRQGFFCVRGSDLDRLQPDDFCAIEAWLADAAFVAPKKDPQPHQIEALDALLPALEANDRVSAIMACGTGKTLIALWVVERRQAAQVLVLVPSLALLRQVLHEWLRETRLPHLAYLCVCSDPTVRDGLDSIATAQSDLDFQVSTDAASVREFLDAPFGGTRIVFSTYQSTRVVGAALKPGQAFDLAIFDEAHKTAGREGRNFAFALENTNLPIRKRLFLTATPRHYNPHKRDGEGDAQLVFSMDRPEVYGPQAYCLSFAEAARRGIICGYKVVISVITSEMVNNELLSRGDVLVNGDPVRARQVANQIALRDAVEKYGTSKAFTFHRTVASAASFVADGSEGVRTHLPTFVTFHVNGTMPTAQRERKMRDFREATRAIMSNARCLTEGVDVPAVDMVAFLSPRRSLVDIVQATGRAMRRSPRKTTGYVLVPLYVEQTANETVEAAVSRSDFDEVWNVLHSLQEQDAVLAELIRQMGEQKGRGKGFDDNRFADRVDIVGAMIGLETLRSAVTTRCFEGLFSSWDSNLGKLTAFKERFGHCNVETGWDEDPVFAGWVSAQRTRRKKDQLTANQVRRMDELGFVWDFQSQKTQETWIKWYHELERYNAEHGNPDVPRTHEDSKLASWVWIQRIRRERKYANAEKLTDEQVALLDKLGFSWDPRDDKWQANFEKLKAFKTEHGHCEIGLVESDDDELPAWVRLQRSLKKAGTLQPARGELLESIGLEWESDAIERRWCQSYELLKQYHATHGNADVPHRWKENPGLGSWVQLQRARIKRGDLIEEQIKLLDDLGFTWRFRDKGTWEDRLAEVVAYKAKHGDCDIPTIFPENPKLGRFVNAMRTQRNRGTLSQDRIVRLDAVGFVWESTRGDGDWHRYFQELLNYKNQHGDSVVPSIWPANQKLANWVGRQRQAKKAGKLDEEKVRLLEANGFKWSVAGPREPWDARYAQLLEFKSTHGHCDVPRRHPANPLLGDWVVNQRSNRKLGKLTDEQQRLLTEVGFKWQMKRRSTHSEAEAAP
jgi:superfamily II DNA or RNA helicase